MPAVLTKTMASDPPAVSAASNVSNKDLPGSHAPVVWVLADHKLGHTRQSIALVDELGWPYEVKQLAFNHRRRWSNLWLGATTLSLDRTKSAELSPPWPDLVIATGRAAAPISRWIKARSGGRTRIVQLGRRGTDQRAGAFDLSVSCGFFGLPPHPRRVETLAPIAAIPPEDLRQAGERWRDLFAGRPRPHVALLVGGSTKVNLLDTGVAVRMASDVSASVEAAGGSLMIVTSPRTGNDVIGALRANLAAGARLYEWTRGDPDNPYLGCLAVGDILIVTGDSESMLAEAAATTKPLYIYPLPVLAAGTRRRRLRAVVGAYAKAEAAATTPLLHRLARIVHILGVVRPPRELDELHRRLIDGGFARPYGAVLDVKPRAPLDEVPAVAAEVRRIMKQQKPANRGRERTRAETLRTESR